MNREYVIVCNRHVGVVKEALLFWGTYTADNEKRSFGGYTSDIERCEKYTLEEAKTRGFPVYGTDFHKKELQKQQDYIIKISELEELGFRKFTIMLR